MTSSKPFKTLEQQIDILKDRKLIIDNISFAKNILKNYGYYEVINGYKDAFLKYTDTEEKEEYKDNSSFVHLYALYDFDKKISNILLESLEEFEQNFKQAFAYSISSKISDKYIEYTKNEHLRNLPDSEILRLQSIFDMVKNSTDQPYQHYTETYDNIPPWIIVKQLTLGNMIFWYKAINLSIKEDIISRLIDDKGFFSGFHISENLNLIDLFSRVLQICLNYRNRAAHGGRIYNHRIKKDEHKINTLGFDFITKHNNIGLTALEFDDTSKFRGSLGVLIALMDMFENKQPYNNAASKISNLITTYLKNYPNDEPYISKSIESKLFLRNSYIVC